MADALVREEAGADAGVVAAAAVGSGLAPEHKAQAHDVDDQRLGEVVVVVVAQEQRRERASAAQTSVR
jgi:hypothetical protein